MNIDTTAHAVTNVKYTMVKGFVADAVLEITTYSNSKVLQEDDTAAWHFKFTVDAWLRISKNTS